MYAKVTKNIKLALIKNYLQVPIIAVYYITLNISTKIYSENTIPTGPTCQIFISVNYIAI